MNRIAHVPDAWKTKRTSARAPLLRFIASSAAKAVSMSPTSSSDSPPHCHFVTLYGTFFLHQMVHDSLSLDDIVCILMYPDCHVMILYDIVCFFHQNGRYFITDRERERERESRSCFLLMGLGIRANKWSEESII